MAGEVPRHSHADRGLAMSELSIFVDESGDFGAQSEFYIVSFVFHDQASDITAEVARLAGQLSSGGLNPEWAIHTGAAIRGEDVYRDMPIEDRRREFSRLFAFARRIPVTYKAFTFRKKEYRGRIKLVGAIARSLSLFLQSNAVYLLAFDHVVVYYDNGQDEITSLLNTLLNAFFFDVEFRRVLPVQYRLFQVADLCCTLELLRIKVDENKLSRSDLHFFESRRALRKNYLCKLDHKRFAGGTT